jgi:competence protein ComEC
VATLFPQLTDSTEHIIKITSVPSISDSFGRTRCSYQGEGFEPHAFLTVQTTSDSECQLQYGATYVLSGKYTNDDFHAKNAATLEVSDKADLYTPYKPANVFDKICNQIRINFLQIAQKLDGDAQGMVPGMSVGDTRFMTKELKDTTKITGLTHLVAISGAHFMIIISLIGGILLALKVPPTLKSVLQIVSVSAMVVLVHPTDSVKRAAIMSTIGLFGIFFKRRSYSISALGFAICGWLIFDPWLATSFGFALSCAATGGIILLTAPVTNWLSYYIGETLATLFSVPIVAQISCYPILLLMTDYLTLYSPVTNVLVIPAIEPATILSLLACIIASIHPPSALLIAQVAGFFTNWISGVATTVGTFPGAKISWISGPVGAILLYAILGAILLIRPAYRKAYSKVTGLAPKEMTGKLTRFHNQRLLLTKRATKFAKGHIGLMCVTLVLVGSTVAVVLIGKTHWNWFSSLPTNWIIAACNAGQGDAVVIRTGSNSGILVDVGNPDRKTGGESVVDCLHQLGVTHLNELQISHYHDDHIGDFDRVLSNFSVDLVKLDPVESPVVNFQHVMSTLKQSGTQYVTTKEGDSNQYGCSDSSYYCVQYTVLSLYNKPGKTEDDAENDSSAATLFTINGVRYFTAGDLEVEGSKYALTKLVDAGISAVDVAKVNHHGSKTQNLNLIKQLRPLVALYTVGKNTYGHPHKDTLTAFEELGAKTLRTDFNGICGITLDADSNIYPFTQFSP